MSVEVRTNIKDPLGWIHDDYGVWNLISDYTDYERYAWLDNIYHCLVDGIEPCNMAGLECFTEEKLKEDYQLKVPFLLAEAFENIAKDIRDGKLIIKTEFE